MDYKKERRTCWVKTQLRGNRCGYPRWAWTNSMEPLCSYHFQVLRIMQNLLVMFSGKGCWGALILQHAYLEGVMTANEARQYLGLDPT